MEERYCRNHPKVLAVEGKTVCAKCLEAKRQDTNRRRARRIAQGLCPRCGKVPPEEGSYYCKECKEKAYKLNQARAARVKEGYCPKHPDVPVKPGFHSCAVCLKREKERMRQKREMSLAKGLCIRCRKAPAVEGILFCEECQKKSTAENLRKRIARHQNHQCSSCGAREFILPGKKTCGDCQVSASARNKGMKLEKGAVCEECHEKPPLLGFPFCRSCLKTLRLTAPERVLKFYPDEILANFMGWLKGEW